MPADHKFDRYERQIRLFGKRGQGKLKKARVFLAGSGGLGCSAAMYLAAAGVGYLRIADHGRVELSNLNRQVLFGEADVGRLKVEVAKRRLRRINSGMEIEARPVKIQRNGIGALVGDCDLVIDALDNFDTRFILNEACLDKGIPLVHGAVFGFYGQATTIVPGRTVCLKCVFLKAPPPQAVPIIGSISGLIGCIQATETIKYFLKEGNLLENKLLMVDGLNIKLDKISLAPNPECELCGRRRS